MRYEHIISDFDGVLCDSLQEAINSYSEVAKNFSSKNMPTVKRKEDMSYVYQGSLRQCLHRWLTPEESRSFFNMHSKLMSKKSEKLSTFSGIGRVFSHLGKGSLSIVSSAYNGAIENILNKDPEFDTDVIYQYCGRDSGKTKTEKILNVLESLNIEPKNAVYIGDLESDVLYCNDVPIDIIAVGYGYQEGEYLKKTNPTYYVNNLDELSNLIERIFLK